MLHSDFVFVSNFGHEQNMFGDMAVPISIPIDSDSGDESNAS